MGSPDETVKVRSIMESIDKNRPMQGLEWDNPYRIRSYRELINWVNEVGFLPLFKNEVPSFSAEEHVSDLYWWTDDEAQDPYIWREIIAGSKEVAYGRFFNGKEGFISLEWLPYFVNYRRNGADSWIVREERVTKAACEQVQKAFEKADVYDGKALLSVAGLDVKEETEADAILTGLQMRTEMVINDFEVVNIENADGSIERMVTPTYMQPEKLWGEWVKHAYGEAPIDSYSRIFCRIQEWFGYEYNDAAMTVIGRFLY